MFGSYSVVAHSFRIILGDSIAFGVHAAKNDGGFTMTLVGCFFKPLGGFSWVVFFSVCAGSVRRAEEEL